jgi:uncharacterized membrane protein
MVVMILSFLNYYSKHSKALKMKGKIYLKVKFSRSYADNDVKIRMYITRKY